MKTIMLLLIFQLLQMSFFGLAAVNDLQPEAKSESTLTRCKDLLFSVFAFPVGMVRNTFFFFKSYIAFNHEIEIVQHTNSMFFAFCVVSLLFYFSGLFLPMTEN